MKIAGVALVCLLLIAVPAQAQVAVPDTMNYQATLLDTAGNPVVTGSYVVEISLFDAASAGNLVWGPQKFNGGSNLGEAPEIQVINGEFSVILGPVDTAATPRNLTDAFLDPGRWLEITIIDFPILSTDTTFAPRQRILSAPYAMRAKDAETLGNQTLQVTPQGVVMIIKAAAPTLRIENSDTGASGNKSVLEFTESGAVRAQVGFTSTGTGTDFVVQSLVTGGKLVLKSQGVTEVEGNLLVSGSGTNTDVFLGRMGLLNNRAGFSHSFMNNSTNFALIQHEAGQVVLNAPVAKTIEFRMGNSDKMRLTNTLFRVFVPTQFNNGTRITGDLQVDGKLTVPGSLGGDLRVDGALSGGQTFIGNVGANLATFAHSSFANLSGYALLQDPSGTTILNRRTGQLIIFRENNVSQVVIRSDGRVNVGDAGGVEFEIRGELRIRNFSANRPWTFAVRPSSNNDLWIFRGSTIRSGIDHATGNFFAVSDRALKTDIQGMTSALERSLRLKPVSFRFKKAPVSSMKSIGFIAQDVQEVAPELVMDMGGTLGLNYSGFGVLAIGAIQELNEKVEDLQARLEQLEALVAGLTN